MTKRLAISLFTIVVLGLGIKALVIFIDTEPAPELFFCNGQPCNVILIIPGSLSARHMGIYGYERDTTPFIDEFFGKEGIVFENAWTNSNWTIISFPSLFTSQLPSDIFVETFKDKLSGIIPTFIDVLDNNKTPKLAAHNWTFYRYMYGYENNSSRSQFGPDELFENTEDQSLFFEVAEWIKRQAYKDDRQSFFLLLQPFGPHAPYNPPEPYCYFFDAPMEYSSYVGYDVLEALMKKESFIREEDRETELQRARLRYDQSIRYLDSQIESFISQIPEETLRNTIFILTSEQGQAFLQHGYTLHRITLYEEEIHVPFLIRVPGIEPRKDYESVTLLDIGPTILEIFGLDIPSTFQGVSLLPVLQGKELQLEERIVRAELVHQPYEKDTPVEWWLGLEPQVRTEPLSSWPFQLVAIRKGKWKLLRRESYGAPFPYFELYNLEKDYYEQYNLIPHWHSLSQEEKTQILPLFKTLGENFPL